MTKLRITDSETIKSCEREMIDTIIGDLDWDVLEKIFDYGSIHGFGGERSLGEGRYTYTIDPVEA